MRKITSRSSICDAINTRCVASENVRKIAVLRTFWPATQWALIASQIGEREVIFRIEIELFCIHHFRVRWISKYLIASKSSGIFPGFFTRKNERTAIAIKYLDIYHTPKWCIQKSFISMRKFTSLTPIFDAINAHCVAGQNVRKTAIFRTFSLATQRVLIASQIGEREVIFGLEIQLFCIHHFRVR